MELVLNYLNTTAIAFLSLSFLYLFLYRFSKGKEAPIVAGAWPILGHLKLLGASNLPHKTLGALADKYGPLFTIKLGLKPALVLSNWEMAKQCFTTNDIAVSSRPKLVAVEVMSYNQAFVGLAPYGTYWRELRKIVTFEFLSNRRIEQLRHIRVSEVQTSIKELVNHWSSKKNVSDYALVDMKQWFANLTFNMVIRMVVGKRYLFNDMDNGGSGDEAKRIMRNIREFMNLMGTFTVADAVPFLRWLDLGGHEKAMKETAKKFDEVLSEWLEEHRQKKALGGKVESDKDFMDVMLSALNDSKIDGYDADTICKATTMELIVGGTDSTAVTLTWALCLLLRNPHVLKQAKEEINTHIGKEGLISESDINKLVYLQAIVKETLRLYPPAPLSSPREFIENCTLGGYHIKKGTRLIPNLWKIHRDPSVWSDPLEFKPERFLTTHKDVDVRGKHFELLPFGSGRRVCAGMSLGLNMVQFTLANFLHSFEIVNPLNEPIDLTEFFGFTNTKATPLEILVKPLLSQNYYETL